MAFGVLASINLDSEGLHYDELHQAVGSFAYLGKRPTMFTYQFRGIPVFNMSYSGAIKSNVYGLYLKYVSAKFSVHSWRLVGIVFVAIGLMTFYQTSGALLPFSAAFVFGALILTDSSVILMSRHDWGPVALGFALRLAFVACWLSIELSHPARWKYFVAGAIVGLAIFEKLSAVVLLGPLGILLLSSRRLKPRAWMAGALGLLAASVPLLLANALFYHLGFGVVSLSEVSDGKMPNRVGNVIEFGYQYLALGQGERAREFALGEPTKPAWPRIEAVAMLCMFFVISWTAFRRRAANRLTFVAGMMAASYAAVGILLLLLPRETSAHHWILGTPFQYVAIALMLAVPAGTEMLKTSKTALYKAAVLSAIAAWLSIRVVNLVSIETALASGTASRGFDPALTRLAELAASRSKHAAFVSADWGTGTQLYCMGNGEDDLVYEPFWNPDPARAMLEIAKTTAKGNIYVVTTGLHPRYEASASVLGSLKKAPNWREAPIEKEFEDLGQIRVQKFTRNHE